MYISLSVSLKSMLIFFYIDLCSVISWLDAKVNQVGCVSYLPYNNFIQPHTSNFKLV